MSRRSFLSGPIHWVLDWDGTLTERDTLDALVAIAAKCKPNSPVGKEWERATQAYTNDYENTIKNYASGGGLPTTISSEKVLLEVLEHVEERSIDRVSESGIFQGLTNDDLDTGAAEALETGRVSLREGCGSFLRLVQSRVQRGDGNGDAISIISANWSRRFIIGCLRAEHADFADMLTHSVYANELDGIYQGTASTGRICVEDARIISSSDKLDQLYRLAEHTLRQGKPAPVVYVGDSSTDLECLLAADMGICIRDNPMTSTQLKLAEALERAAVSCVPLRDVDGPYSIVWIEDFHELRKWIEYRN